MLSRLAPLPILLSIGAAAPAADLEVSFEKVRNRSGMLRLCLTQAPAHFPDCKRDPKAIMRNVIAGTGSVRFPALLPGTYAVSVFHDENNNRKLDTLLGIPKEGFGFSRNPVVRFGAPRFKQVSIDLRSGFTRETVRMQYLL